MTKSKSLRTQFAFTFAILMALLSMILSSLIGLRSSKEVKSEIGSSLSETATQMSGKMDQYMWGRAGEIEVLKDLDAFKNPDDLEEIEYILNLLKTTFPSFSWVGFTDPKGVVQVGTDGILTGRDISDRKVYKEGLKGKFIGDVYDAALLSNLLPNPSGETMKFVDISNAVYGYDGEIKGVLTANLSWKWAKEIEQLIVDPLRYRKDIELFIVSDRDKSIVLGPPELVGKTFDLESIKQADKDGSGWIVETWPDGEEYLTGFSKGSGYMNFEGLNWTVLIRQPSKNAYQVTKRLQNYILILGAGLTMVFAFVGWLIAGRVVKPLNGITNVANQLINGEDVVIPTYNGIRDIEILSSSLRKLVNTLTHTENVLVEMEDLANHDELTGLPNRVALNLYMKTIEFKANKNNSTLAFLYLDLDGFKSVNDTSGHDVGDEVLKESANRIKQNVRSEEIVVRLGGDEFLVILSTSLDSYKSEIESVSKRILSDINEDMLIGENIVNIGCSIGASVWPIDTDDISEAINLADKALYESKRLDKNRLTFYMDIADNSQAK